MKISVVTVSYNAVHEIEETILSVLNQTYSNIEYIIIDGGSTDGTVDIIRKYADQLAYWISEPDKGIYDAMNKGIAAATGDYINFMNAGDIFSNNDVLNQFVPNLHDHPDIVYGSCNIKLNGDTAHTRPMPISALKKKMPFCHQACFVSTPFHQKHMFDASFKVLADYNMFYNAYKNGAKFQYIPICVANYDIGYQNTSSVQYKLYIRERYRIWGIENEPIRKIPSELQLIYIRITNTIKRILPPKMILKIKRTIEHFRSHDNIS